MHGDAHAVELGERVGAEHGVASAVTRTPLRNASAAGGVRPAATESVPPNGVSSKTPSVIDGKRVRTPISSAIC